MREFKSSDRGYSCENKRKYTEIQNIYSIAECIGWALHRYDIILVKWSSDRGYSCGNKRKYTEIQNIYIIMI